MYKRLESDIRKMSIKQDYTLKMIEVEGEK